MVDSTMMAGDARGAVLRAIATALADDPQAPLPDPIDALDDVTEAGRAALAQRFRAEISRVGGEARFVADDADLPDAIAAYVVENGLGPASVDLTTADYALLRAEALLADTGSAVIVERTSERRLAPYLPRTCIIVGNASDLHPHLTIRSLRPFFAPAREGDTGEALIVTGPSRTADVEKTIVLGAHGPRHVVVFIVGVDPSAEETA
jgi:hypothetical protein